MERTITDLVKAGFSFVGVVNSIFLSLYLFFRKSGRRTSNFLLASILAVISLRIGKSVIHYLIYPRHSLLFITLGHFSMSMLGPLVYFFIRSLVSTKFRFRLIHLLHFLFSLSVLIGNTIWILKGYSYGLRHSLILLQTCVYVILSFAVLKRTVKNMPQSVKESNVRKYRGWFAFLFIVFSIVLGYFAHNVLGWMNVTSVPFMYTLCLFIMFYMIAENPSFYLSSALFSFKRPVLPPQESVDIFQQIMNRYEQKKLFLDPELTLSKLSAELNIKSYKISRVINNRTKSSFIEFTNRFRIKEAERLLKEKNSQHNSILSISYDCGFNSWSAFSTAFKKINHCSPTEFKDN